MRTFPSRRPLALTAISLAILGLSTLVMAQRPRSTAAVAGPHEALPLVPTRTVAFTTDEGTWMSVDLAPDGATIAFDLLGDLYTVPIAGGHATRITSGMAFDGQPRFSPDGRWLAFVSDRSGGGDVWLVRPDGSDPRPLVHEEEAEFYSPAWTPDGEQVVVTRQVVDATAADLWKYAVNGGAATPVTNGHPGAGADESGFRNALGVQISRDGRTAFYARSTGSFSSAALTSGFPAWQIVRRDLATGVERTLTNAPGSAIRPLISPDGATLVFGTRVDGETALRLMDLRTGDQRWLVDRVNRDAQESRPSMDLLPGYAFTRDGRELIVSYGGKIRRVDVRSGASRVIPFSADVSLDLGPRLVFAHRLATDDVRARVIMAPAQSPDGRRLTFSALSHLYVMDLPSGEPRRLIGDQPAYQPVWSADGRWIAYVTWSTPDGGHIWKVRSDGTGAPVQLTRDAAYYRDVAWAPGGNRLVALRGTRQERVEMTQDLPDGQPNTLDLVWVRADCTPGTAPTDGAACGDVVAIADGRGLANPHFSGDPDRVYAYGPAAGLVAMRWDGTDRQTRLRIVGRGRRESQSATAAALYARISPDGQWVLAHLQHQLYLVKVPPGQPQTIHVNAPATPVRKLTPAAADYFAWADEGATITWAIGSTFSRVPLAAIAMPTPAAEAAASSGRRVAGTTLIFPGADQPLPHAAATEFSVSVDRPRARPQGSIVLRGARVITMGAGAIVQPADILVTGERIVAAGAQGSIALPPGARIVDVASATIVPGYIDMHPHWRRFGWGVHDERASLFAAVLSQGITTGRDPSTRTSDIFTYQDRIDAGDMPGPRAFSTGPSIYDDSDINNVEEADQVVGKYRRHYRTDFIKQYNAGPRRVRQWVAQAAARHALTATVEGNREFRLHLTNIVDGFNTEHTYPISPVYQDVIQLVARSQSTYTPTLVINQGSQGTVVGEDYYYWTTEVHDDAKLRRFLPHSLIDRRVTTRRTWRHRMEDVTPMFAADAARIVRAGGVVTAGSHSQLEGMSFHWELWEMVRGGMTPMEALQAATIAAARGLGYDQDLGSIERGKLADLVVLRGNPLDDVRHTAAIRYVMKNGVLYDGDTLDEIWPSAKPFGPNWWWATERR